MTNRAVAIVDCGAGNGKYRVARHLTEQHIYCEVYDEKTPKEVVDAIAPAGVLRLEKADMTASEIERFVQKTDALSTPASFSDFTKAALSALKGRVGGKKVLCALSGGVDSAVTAAMIHAVNPEGLTCVFVDHGLLRKGEAEEVMRVFRDERGMNVIKIDAADRYLEKLKGVDEPEQKRKIIGGEFIRIFEEEARKIGKVNFLAQGTIYPDILESIDGVKAHHNVGGLPAVVDFDELVEPLQFLFKDEVRKLGAELGLPESMVMRQPFPGPGLGVRVLGEVTREKLDILRDADWIYRQEILNAGLNKEIWQYFVALPGFRSVGVSDGKRTYGYTAVLRAILTKDAMTARVARIPFELLEKISARITTEVPLINRVVYDITNKPPATIEWE